MSQFKLLEEDKANINHIISNDNLNIWKEQIDHDGYWWQDETTLTDYGYQELEKFIGEKIKLAQKIAFDAGYMEWKKSVEV